MPHPEITDFVYTLLENESDYDRVTGLSAIADYLQDKETLTPHVQEFMDFAIAVKNGDSEAIARYIDNHKIFVSKKMLLACPADIQEYHTPLPFLFYAAHHAGKIENALIYADINETNFYGRTLLMDAAQKGDINTVERLLKHGADIQVKDNDGNTACMLAALSGNDAIAQLLMEHGANINGRNVAGDNVMHMAARLDNPALISQLRNLGANIKEKNARKFTPLSVAVKHKKENSVEALLNAGAEVDVARDSTKTTALLMMVGQYGTVKIVELLLSFAKTSADEAEVIANAITQAARYGNTAVLEYCIKLPANPVYSDVRSENASRSVVHFAYDPMFWKRALMLAAESGNLAAFKLLATYFDENYADNDRTTALMHARGKDIIEYLLEEGADVHVKDVFMYYRDAETLQSLIDRGANPYESDQHGMNAFLVTAAYGNVPALQYFIAHHPKILGTTMNDGTNALMLAAGSGNSEAVALLLPYFDVNATNQDGKTALMFAQGKAVTDMLLKHKAEINAIDKAGNTALIHSSRLRTKEAVIALIDAKADLDVINNQNKTAIHYASMSYGGRSTNPLAEALVIAGATLPMLPKSINKYHVFLRDVEKFKNHKTIFINFLSRTFDTLGEFFPESLLEFIDYGHFSKILSKENFREIVNTQHRHEIILKKREEKLTLVPYVGAAPGNVTHAPVKNAEKKAFTLEPARKKVRFQY